MDYDLDHPIREGHQQHRAGKTPLERQLDAEAMPHTYTEDQLVKQPALGLFAE